MSTIVGLIGVGRMGLPVCANLVRAGFTVTATDLRPERTDEARAAGAGWARDAEVAAQVADVLITVLPGPGDLREAMEAAAPGLRPGVTWIDLTTSTPAVGAELRDRLGTRAIDCLDAPMGGGPAAAAAGTLQLFVGGAAEIVERHRALLERLGTVNHIGGHGAGYTAKLLVNLLWFGQALATGEALLLARRAGIDLDVLRGALERSAASSEFIRRDLDSLFAGEYRTAFGLDRCYEELEAVTALATELEVPSELSSVVARLYGRALDRYGPVDGELLPVAMLEEQAGIRLRRDS